MDHKTLTAYGVCDDCKEHGEPFCYPLGDGYLGEYDGKLLCQECFERGPYQTYDEDADEYTPKFHDLIAPGANDVRVECDGKIYRLTEVQ